MRSHWINVDSNPAKGLWTQRHIHAVGRALRVDRGRDRWDEATTWGIQDWQQTPGAKRQGRLLPEPLQRAWPCGSLGFRLLACRPCEIVTAFLFKVIESVVVGYSSPVSAASWLCDLGRVTETLWSSIVLILSYQKSRGAFSHREPIHRGFSNNPIVIRKIWDYMS